MIYTSMSKDELTELKSELLNEYDRYKALNLKLDMSRGKPSSLQLDLSTPMMDAITSKDLLKDENGNDLRNYGILDGIPEAKKLFAEMLDVSCDEIIVGGNSSLAMMYDTIQRGLQFGLYGSECPWNDLPKIKFLCPSPGYDRHFAICELFGIEMITIPMTSEGPDMDMIEKLVSSDSAIKGIWCVPLYSNPEGIVYSDKTVKRMAALKPAASDFRIFWDNAYCVHHIYDDSVRILNILEECKKSGNEDMVVEFASTSKISFSGAGVAAVVSSVNNINYFKKLMSIRIIGFDKINQLRHVKFFKNLDGIKTHMKKHADCVRPKFDKVIEYLSRDLEPYGVVRYTKPNGGYFISVDTPDDCAKKTVDMCKQLGVTLTPAGVTYPYSKDPHDANIRIAPTLPPVEELDQAMKIFCVCVKLATIETLLNK